MERIYKNTYSASKIRVFRSHHFVLKYHKILFQHVILKRFESRLSQWLELHSNDVHAHAFQPMWTIYKKRFRPNGKRSSCLYGVNNYDTSIYYSTITNYRSANRESAVARHENYGLETKPNIYKSSAHHCHLKYVWQCLVVCLIIKCLIISPLRFHLI